MTGATDPPDDRVLFTESSGRENYAQIIAMTLTLAAIVGVLAYLVGLFDTPLTVVAVVIGTSLGTLFAVRPRTLTVGEDWLAVGRKRIAFSEVRRVTVMRSGVGPSVQLTDRRRRPVSTFLVDLQRDPRLWGHVATRIRHVIEHGHAATNKRAAAMFTPEPPGPPR